MYVVSLYSKDYYAFLDEEDSDLAGLKQKQQKARK